MSQKEILDSYQRHTPKTAKLVNEQRDKKRERSDKQLMKVAGGIAALALFTAPVQEKLRGAVDWAANHNRTPAAQIAPGGGIVSVRHMNKPGHEKVTYQFRPFHGSLSFAAAEVTPGEDPLEAEEALATYLPAQDRQQEIVHTGEEITFEVDSQSGKVIPNPASVGKEG